MHLANKEEGPRFTEGSRRAWWWGAGASETVATVGLWDQQPNIYNAVPRSVRLDVDIRDHDKTRRDGVIAAALDGAAEIAAARKCGHSAQVMFEYPTARSHPKVRLSAALSTKGFVSAWHEGV